VAYGEAMESVKGQNTLPVPEHLRNAPTRLMKELGYGRDYDYSHDNPEAWSPEQRYFPDGMEEQRYYRPVPRGLEIKIAEKLDELRRKRLRKPEDKRDT
jgi:putative ATPase